VAITEALTIAQQRGMVQVAGDNPESLFDFVIVSVLPVAFVRVKYAARFLVPLIEIASGFSDDLARLRSLPEDAAISRELWLRSKHGSWRFFRITAGDIAELGRDGRPCAAMASSVVK
jgi:hypothetical protein